MKTKQKLYAIQSNDWSWYWQHGTACIQTTDGKFPSSIYRTEEEARKVIEDIAKYHPNEAQYYSVVEISYSMREIIG